MTLAIFQIEQKLIFKSYFWSYFQKSNQFVWFHPFPFEPPIYHYIRNKNAQIKVRARQKIPTPRRLLSKFIVL